MKDHRSAHDKHSAAVAVTRPRVRAFLGIVASIGATWFLLSPPVPLLSSTGLGETVTVEAITVDGNALDPGGSGSGTAAAGGDLFHTITCRGGGSTPNPDQRIYLYLDLLVNDDVVARDVFEAYWIVEGSVTATVRASADDRPVRCEASSIGSSYASKEGTLVGAGPTHVRLTLGAFIPDSWIWDPRYSDTIFGGDNRGFQEAEATGRVAQVIDILNPALSNSDVLSGPHHYAGLSEQYEHHTSVAPYSEDCETWQCGLTWAARDDWSPGEPRKMDWSTADTNGMSCSVERQGPNPSQGTSSSVVRCNATAYNPLVRFAPAIDYSLDFTLTFGRRKVVYQYSGCHDGYPAYEAYLGGRAVMTRTPTGSVWALWGNCDTSESGSGEVQ